MAHNFPLFIPVSGFDCIPFNRYQLPSFKAMRRYVRCLVLQVVCQHKCEHSTKKLYFENLRLMYDKRLMM